MQKVCKCKEQALQSDFTFETFYKSNIGFFTEKLKRKMKLKSPHELHAHADFRIVLAFTTAAENGSIRFW